jgi:hypothetical protein
VLKAPSPLVSRATSAATAFEWDTIPRAPLHDAAPAGTSVVRLDGLPVRLAGYAAASISNRNFRPSRVWGLDRFYLPPSLTPLVNGSPIETREFIEDDNRSAIFPDPVAQIDGMDFYLSVKGIGSTIDPYSWRSLDRSYAAELVRDPDVARRLLSAPSETTDRIITGEMWLQGSPYGGQGWDHAAAALSVSERATGTDLEGFRVAPVLQVSYLPEALEAQLREIYWYRKFRGRMVQELRLVPSNVRIYFHARTTVGTDIARVFDRFSLTTSGQALAFEVNFLRSAIAMLTLFARTMIRDETTGGYRGLDFHDVWLDKDAVLAPNGTVYFVDLEGIAEVCLAAPEVRERMDDQIYRSLYEMMFAFEQIERERARRFGGTGNRRAHFERLLREALRDDRYVRLRREGPSLEMEIRNRCGEESLLTTFRALDE